MLYAYASPIVAEAIELARAGERTESLRRLRELPLADFCQLLHDISAAPYAALTDVLPRMASEADQNQWTGHSGHPLMIKSCNFARLLDILAYRCTGAGLKGKRILDYGCGWGRMIRVMYYYSDLERVYGADPWDRSLEVCAATGVRSPLTLCAEVPTAAPFQHVKFDMIFSFSVFTHLSETASRAVLRACRAAVAPNGIYVITIRPVEFWDMRKAAMKPEVHERVTRDHRELGFAFAPVNWPRDQESATFGDTPIDWDFMRAMARDEGWDVAQFDRDLMEPYQIAVALRPI
jgi:2-polyprenyl-3-methyl-5-hydroxy-6-metoxy-1,4-benzoquinol methylase